MKSLLILAVLIASGCSALPVQIQSDPAVMQILQQHTMVLNGIASYVKNLQDKGVLPKPEPIEKE